jgi:hypothetical protein
VNPKEGKDKYGDVKFADPENSKYPIDTEAHIRAAWNYINKEKNAGKYKDGGASVKRRIIAAWKSKIDPKGPPSAAEKMLAGDDLQKCMYHVAALASLIDQLDGLAESCACEEEYEGDGSTIAAALERECENLCEILQQMVEEESAEIVADGKEEPHPEAPTAEPEEGPEAMAASARVEFEKMVDAKVADKVKDLEAKFAELQKKFDNRPAPGKAAISGNAPITVTKDADAAKETESTGDGDDAFAEMKKALKPARGIPLGAFKMRKLS